MTHGVIFRENNTQSIIKYGFVVQHEWFREVTQTQS